MDKKEPVTFQGAARLVADECLELMFRKQNDYGPRNILDLGVRGVFCRAYDKVARLKRLVWEGKDSRVLDEGVEDTWRDLANYGMIAVMVERGWFGLPFEESEEEKKKGG